MMIGRYRLLGQIGAGPDGASYRAQASDTDAPVELHVLAAAHEDAERWQWLIRRLRLVSLLDHPASVRIVEAALDHDPPYVAVDWAEPVAGGLPALAPMPVADALHLMLPLANLLASAHLLGLVHGQIEPAFLTLSSRGRPKLDFTRIATRGPVAPGRQAADQADDVRDFGLLLLWLVTGRHSADDMQGAPKAPAAALSLGDKALAQIASLLNDMLAAEPGDRPSARQVERAVAATLASPGDTLAVPPVAPPEGAVSLASMGTVDSAIQLLTPEVDVLLARGQLGRFRLLQQLGQGGMGTVYRAEDPADGSIVAIKVLRPAMVSSPDALRRFHKEARMLAEVNNPYVTNLLEVNEDNGVRYLVLEFVDGANLGQRLSAEGRYDEPTALATIACVARGLAAAHERGIIHRDVKPENILLIGAAQDSTVKLSDFGLARHVLESESLNVTQAGALLGTPHYMAPEQFAGGAVDARADVYSLGATLYHLLAGRPPFVANTVLAIAAMHRNDPPTPLRQINKDVSDGTCQLLERMLAKAPDARPADAVAVLRELERLLRGEPSDLAVHPRMPVGDPGRVLHYDWSWELQASPRQLWPHVSNTERVNRAIGLPAIEYVTQVRSDGVERTGTLHKLGITSAYREHPFEWIEARRMGVLREFTSGPFKWLVSITELIPRAGGGTTLNHQVRIEPHGLLGRTVAAVEVGIKARRSLERVYRRIDAALTGQFSAVAMVDPFEEPAELLSRAQQRRLDELLDRLTGEGVDPAIAERLADFLAQAPAQEVARIRPLALACRLGLPPDALVTACLRSARAGLLVLLWDLICPICRIPSEIKDTLRALKDHGHCEACNADYELDFARSVEMIFRVHPEIRAAELGIYCIGGPAHSPHVVAQVRLAPGERVEMELALAEGSYRLRGPQLPYALDFRVQPGAPLGRWDVGLGAGIPRAEYRVLRPGAQLIAIKNEHIGELVVRVERMAARDDALTAARAASLSLFRELFPTEVLSPGHLVSVATVTLLVTDLDVPADTYARLGDAPAFAIIHEHFRLLDERIRRSGGALIKTVGEGLVAVFDDPAAAVETALDLQSVLQASATTRSLCLKVAVHRGPAMAATLNDHLDYFGATVRDVCRLPALANGGHVVLTQSVTADVRVAALLAARDLAGGIVEESLPGLFMGPIIRVRARPDVGLPRHERSP